MIALGHVTRVDTVSERDLCPLRRVLVHHVHTVLGGQVCLKVLRDELWVCTIFDFGKEGQKLRVEFPTAEESILDGLDSRE